MKLITAFDPGPHVGVAQWDGSAHQEWEVTPQYIFTDGERIIQWSDAVVCEDFNILGSRDKNSNQTIELIGVLRYLCWKNNTPFFTQRPADAKLASNDKLKKLGWWVPASNDHARSAARHLLTFLINTRQIDVSTFLEG
jgi:hypothetical protein